METTSVKVWHQTLKRLKLLATVQEDTMMNVLDRLVVAVLARAQGIPAVQTIQAQQKDAPRAGDSCLQDGA